MPTLDKVKEKDKVPANVSFSVVELIIGVHTRNEMPRSLHKELIAQVSSFSGSPKAFPSDLHLDSPYKNCTSFSFQKGLFQTAETTRIKNSKNTLWEQNVL